MEMVELIGLCLGICPRCEKEGVDINCWTGRAFCVECPWNEGETLQDYQGDEYGN